MSERETISVWEDLPSVWQDPPTELPPIDSNRGTVNEKNNLPISNSDETVGGNDETSIANGHENVNENDNLPIAGGSGNVEKTEEEKHTPQESDTKQPKGKGKINKISSDSQKVKEAYEKERGENRKDFIVVAIATVIVIIGIIVFVMCFTKTDNQKIYDLIESGNYATAYQGIVEQYEKDKNVDELVYTFVEICVNNSEYKRAIASLDMLSDGSAKKEQFFDQLVNNLISHSKENRAEDVLTFLKHRGNEFSQIAEKLYEKYANEL